MSVPIKTTRKRRRIIMVEKAKKTKSLKRGFNVAVL